MAEKTTITSERAIEIAMEWLNTVEVSGYKSVWALGQTFDLLNKVKNHLHETAQPEPGTPIVELEPVTIDEAEGQEHPDKH